MASVAENSLTENFNSMSLVSNPVGKLQETCLKRKWTSPIYDTDDEDGPPHDRVFTVCCRLENLNIEVRGKGRSKKGAKKLAAQQMLDFLQTEGLLENRDESDKFGGKSAKDEDNGLKETLKFIENLKNDEQLRAQMIEFDIDQYDEADYCDYCRELDKIASSISCKIVYVDREENETSFALLRTSKENEPQLTVLTGWGMDDDVGRARRKAAQTILTILDRMVRCKV